MTGSDNSGPGRDRHEIGDENGWDASPDDNGSKDSSAIRQLALDDDEEASLPWLDADDDDEDYESSDGLKILGLVIAGLVVLAAIIGGIWWTTHRDADADLVADGSTIEAPATPFKEAPEDPGGKTFDGTGDTSFAMSEGQNQPARLGEAPQAPVKPSIDLAQDKEGDNSGAAGGVGVQVGAYSSREKAEAGWTRIAINPALSGVSHRVLEGQADIGTVYRLQAVAGDAASAQALCARLKAAGIACQVKN